MTSQSRFEPHGRLSQPRRAVDTRTGDYAADESDRYCILAGAGQDAAQNRRPVGPDVSHRSVRVL
jgi:hypothetical protein